MIIIVIIVTVIVVVVIALNLDEKRKKEALALAEIKRRESFIDRLKATSQEIDRDPNCQKLLGLLDDIILPQQLSISSISIRTATITVRTQVQHDSKWSTIKDKVVEVSTLPYEVAFTKDNDQIAFAYTLIKRYPFLCYRYTSSAKKEGTVTTRDLAKVYFDAFNDSSHHQPRILSNLV